MLQQIKSLPLTKPTLNEFRIQVRQIASDNKYQYSKGKCSEHLTHSYRLIGIDTSDLHKQMHSYYADLFYLNLARV